MNQLFSRDTTSTYLYQAIHNLNVAADRLSPEALDGKNDDEIIDDLVTFLGPRPVMLRRDQEHIDGPEQVQIDVGNNFGYAPTFGGGPRLVLGARFTLVVPFDGSPELLDLRPSTYTLVVPSADVVGTSLRFTVEETTPDAARIRGRFDGMVQAVQQWIDNVNADVARDLDGWRRQAVARIAAQRTRRVSFRLAGEGLRGAPNV